ncbi:hypothetical protein GCM10010402_66040 [Actinomadura luteofluorescens]|uniref:hypothetical protein n=1 Tax=Actinomadura luteofluorescens TaxID=46163 RepID=UPI0021640C64|nr:hypothetical protein [Actinomadura glauciflava]MCR3744223.1 hypothetical protein [Actinomadura glauciflava]
MADEPGNGELARQIADFRRDVRDDFATVTSQLTQFVLREVYQSDKAALEARLARMERESEAARSAARNALYACLGTIVAAIVVAVLVKGGGK